SESAMSYDKRVAGVISGAGGYKPGLILDNKQSADDHRVPVALMGKVYCKVDAQYGSIEVGDLLTTSATPGHAMKVQDPMQAFGAVIGKALRSLAKGKALVPILAALQSGVWIRCQYYQSRTQHGGIEVGDLLTTA